MLYRLSDFPFNAITSFVEVPIRGVMHMHCFGSHSFPSAS
jgi:hypothetical protein